MNIAICGINGAMGKILKEEIQKDENHNLLGYLSPRNGKFGDDIKEKIDIVIDFSRPDTLDFLLDYCIKNNIPLMICTTGYTKEQLEKIKKAGEKIKILLSSNTSVGINITRKILMLISPLMKDYDIEMIEKHHNKKLDKPSGTAKTLKDDILNATHKSCIQVHAIRAGNIVGEHEVIFAKDDEIIQIKHTALSKKVFAKGALHLAEKLIEKKVGFYDTMDII